MDEPEQIKDIIERKNDSMILKSSDNAGIEQKPKKSNVGGRREGAGRPKGALGKRTLGALQAKQRYIERVNKSVDKLFDAQLDLALGEKILMVKRTERNEDGKILRTYHEAVTDPELISKYLDNEVGDEHSDYHEINDDESFYYMTTKSANNQAITAMLDRAYGKAPERIDITGGFFKVNDLNIQIINPEINTKIDGTDSRQIIDVEAEQETTSSDSDS